MNCPSAWVGALAGRGDAISNEWKLETRAKLEAGDLKITAIIKVGRHRTQDTGHRTDMTGYNAVCCAQDTATYKLPSVSPDGKYYGPTTCSAGTNHS